MPESGVTKHNYLFCQFVNPARGHEGDRCDCFDTPSQRRTTLAKQRLARLRANREINRASTSNDPESAVASDPAVTLRVIEFRGYPLLVGLRRKGRGGEAMGERQTSGDRATEKQRLLRFSRKFTVLDLVKLKASTAS